MLVDHVSVPNSYCYDCSNHQHIVNLKGVTFNVATGIHVTRNFSRICPSNQINHTKDNNVAESLRDEEQVIENTLSEIVCLVFTKYSVEEVVPVIFVRNANHEIHRWGYDCHEYSQEERLEGWVWAQTVHKDEKRYQNAHQKCPVVI